MDVVEESKQREKVCMRRRKEKNGGDKRILARKGQVGNWLEQTPGQGKKKEKRLSTSHSAPR